jgi:uncharacterized protein YlaI
MSCKKTSFANEKFALEYIDKLSKTSVRRKNPTKAYLCPKCINWHLTSQEDRTQVTFDKIMSSKNAEIKNLENRDLKKERKINELKRKVNTLEQNQHNCNKCAWRK